jgi:TonB-dependent receptor
VSKTLMPDQDANSLGGTVEVKSLSAFDLPGTALSLQAGASRDQNTGKVSPSAGLLAARRFMDGKLGVAAGLSTEKRRFGSDNVETGGGWEDGKLSNLEMRNYLPQRERHALAVNLDYRPQAGQTLYLRSFLSRFSDDEVRDRLTISDISDDAAAPGETFSARGERRLRQRKYTQQISSVTFGGEQRAGDWKLSAAGGLSRAGEDTPESINDARFRGSDDFEGLSYSGTRAPRLNGPASLSDPASYRLRGITLQARESDDAERHVRLDLARKLDTVSLQGGIKLSRRSKQSDTEQWGYNSNSAVSGNYWGAGSLSMSDFSMASLDYPFAQLGPGINPALIRARVAGLSRAGARLAAESTLDDFRLDEDINAGYVQASLEQGDWHLLAGVRNERTRFKARGNQVSEDGATPLASSKSYSDWLPNLQLRYEIDAHTSVRAAWTNSVVRANFSQLAPGVSLDSDTEAVIGNPQLKPLTSSNVDVGVERMLGADGALSVYVYAKNIKDFAYTTDLAGTGAWTDFEVATSYANGDRARVRGIELAYSQALRQLPAPWNGVIVGANASFNSAKATIGRYDIGSGSYHRRSIRMPGQSKQVVNLMLGYESGKLSTRLALNHKSNYLLEVGGDILDPKADAYVDGQRQLDFSFGYKLGKSMQLVFEAINLNNETYYVYQGSKAFNTQYEQYGRSFKLSLKANLL